MLRFINIVIIFLLVAPILGQSQNHPVPGTLYAPLYQITNGVAQFIGWEGKDGTYVTETGLFYDSITYSGTQIEKGPCIYEIQTDIETFSILGFKLSSVGYQVSGVGLPAFSYSSLPEPKFPNVDYNLNEEDYPLPLSGKGEDDAFIQRCFIHIYKDAPFGVSRLSSHLSSKITNGYTEGTSTYYGAGLHSAFVNYCNFIGSLYTGRAVIVSSVGECVAKDGFEFLSVTLEHSVDQPIRQLNGYVEIKDFIFLYDWYPPLTYYTKTLGGGAYQFYWKAYEFLSYTNDLELYPFLPYGKCTRRFGSFYYRNQYGEYVSSYTFNGVMPENRVTSSLACLRFHKSLPDYEIWYVDRKYYAAGYSNNNPEGGGSDGSPPALPSPPTELSEFRYFSKDDDGNFHLKIDGVLNNFKTQLKEKYKFNFLGIDGNKSKDNESGEVSDFQSGLVTSIEEVNSSDPLTLTVEHRFDIVKGQFVEPEIAVDDTELVFDYQKWFDVEILYVIRCIILFILCIEFFFMTLKLFI